MSAAQDTLTITFTGDILLDRGVRQRINAIGIDSLFTPEIDSIFAHSDIVVGNLECPATSTRTPAMKQFVFRGEPEWLEALRRHGITHLNLANNHSVDQRRKGLIPLEWAKIYTKPYNPSSSPLHPPRSSLNQSTSSPPCSCR